MEKEEKKKLTKAEKEEKEMAKAKEKLKKIKIEKKPKKEEKKEENKEEPQKKSLFKRIFTSYAFLYSTFAILLVAVIVLSVLVLNHKEDPEKESADLFLPIIYSNTKNNIKVDLSELYRKGEYVLKIANYHGKKVNEEKINYNIVVENATKNHIKIVKNADDRNLMVDQEATRIEDGSLKGYVKQTDVYTITVKERPKEGDEISLVITS